MTTQELSIAIGIDVGGTGIKGALVDPNRGRLCSERIRVDTPSSRAPDDVVQAITSIVSQLPEPHVVGCTFPSVVQKGVVQRESNFDPAWVGMDIERALSERLEKRVHVLNDADAAGIAELHFGAGRKRSGVVLLLTFGTGIGSALFVDGILVPNTELGELELDGHVAETRAAASLRKQGKLSWDQWIQRVQRYLDYVERLFSPNLIVFGGGISKRADRFLPQLHTNAELVPAELRNSAGIVGAAWAACRYQRNGM